MSKDKRMILGSALDAFERLDLSKVQSINLELVEYDDSTNKLALEVIYSPEAEKNEDGFLYSASNATVEERRKRISDLMRGASGL